MTEAGNLSGLPRQNGATIRAIRKLAANNMSIDGLAEAVGLAPQAVRNIENESTQASWETLARMARALSVSVGVITRWPPTEPITVSFTEEGAVAAKAA